MKAGLAGDAAGPPQGVSILDCVLLLSEFVLQVFINGRSLPACRDRCATRRDCRALLFGGAVSATLLVPDSGTPQSLPPDKSPIGTPCRIALRVQLARRYFGT
jgi:hypothetical protein